MLHRDELARLAIEFLGGLGDRFLRGLGFNDSEPLGFDPDDVDVPAGERFTGHDARYPINGPFWQYPGLVGIAILE